MRYYIIKCKKCGNIGVGATNNILKYRYKCPICNKSFTLKSKRKAGLSCVIYKSYDTGTEANKFVTKLKEEVLKQKESIGFKTYE